MTPSEVSAPELWLFASVPHHALIEMAAYLGMDGVVIDDEKVHAGPEQMQAMFLAAEKHRMPAKVRLRESSAARIEYILSLGAHSLLLPRLTDVASVTAAIASTRFPLGGTRGLGHSRATSYGLRHSWSELLEGIEEPPGIEVIVETREILADLDEVAALDSVRGLDIGLLDLSAALGRPGETSAPEVQSAIDRVIAVARSHGKPVGMSVSNPANAVEMRERGLSSLVLDTAMLLKTGVNQFREALTRAPASAMKE